METQGLARFAPLTGAAAVVLWFVGVVYAESDRPDDNAPATELVAYMSDKDAQIFISAGLFCLGSALFIWFLASLASFLRTAGDDGRLATIVVAGGTAMAAIFSLVTVPNVAGALAVENLDRTLSPETAETLWVLADGFFVVAELLAVAMLGAAALAILRTRALPAWFGFLTALAAVVLIILPVGWAVLIWGVPLWTLAVSIWIFVKEGRAGVVPAVAT